MRWYRDLKLSAKLILGFLLVAALAGVVGVFGYLNLHKLEQADTSLYQKNALGLLYAGEMGGAFRAERGFIMQALLVKTEGERKEALKGLAVRAAAFTKATEKYPETYIDEGDKQLFLALMAKHETYSKLKERAVELLQQGDVDRASALVQGDLYQATLVVVEELQKMMDDQAEMAKATWTGNQELAPRPARR